MSTEQKEQETEYIPNAKDNRDDLAILSYQTFGAIESILGVLKQFKKDHYDSEGDEIDGMLDEIQDSLGEIAEIV